MNRYRWLVTRFALVVFVVPLVLAGCGESEETPLAPETENPFLAHAVGTEGSFEAVTWNLHNFAEDAGTREIQLAADAIRAMAADVVGLQEIASALAFDRLLEELPEWSGHTATSDRYQNLAYVWKTEAVTVTNGPYEILAAEYRPFPRTPLVLEIQWRDQSFVLINNHFKAFGDGTLDAADPDDEETRRRDASVLLDEWIVTNAPDRAVIVLGDLNDLISDPSPHNVFQVYLDQPESYRFTDMPLAVGAPGNWSWGPGQSHLDHLLVTDELFVVLQSGGSEVRTIRLDRSLAAGSYRDLLSDHAPVALKLAY